MIIFGDLGGLYYYLQVLIDFISLTLCSLLCLSMSFIMLCWVFPSGFGSKIGGVKLNLKTVSPLLLLTWVAVWLISVFVSF